MSATRMPSGIFRAGDDDAVLSLFGGGVADPRPAVSPEKALLNRDPA